MVGWSLQKKRMCSFSKVDFVLRKFLERLYFISVYRVLEKLSKDIFFCTSKGITLPIFCLLLKSSKAFPANTLHKSNVILWLYFGNLRKLLSSNVDVTIILITWEIRMLPLRWLSLRKFCYVNIPNTNVNKTTKVLV